MNFTRAAEQESSAGRRYEAAEGLRGMAALAILTFHAASETRVIGQGGAGRYLQHLDLGVSVFFVLSAFLLYRPFVAARFSGGRSPRPVAYLWRRALRILPGYWVALTVGTYVLLQASLGSPSEMLRFYGLAQIYDRNTALGGLVVAWSLCTEATFYLYLPVHAAFMRRWGGKFDQKVRGEFAACVGLYTVGVVFKAVVRPHHQLTSTWLPAYIDTFALGMALAVATVAAEQRGEQGRWSAQVANFPGVAWMAAATGYLVLANAGLPAGLLSPISAVDYLGQQGTLGVIALLMVAPAVLAPAGAGLVNRVLASRPAQWLGRISFGVFLWHVPVMERLNAELRPRGSVSLPWVPLMAVSLVVTLAIALVSWTSLERPILALKHRGPGSHR